MQREDAEADAIEDELAASRTGARDLSRSVDDDRR
jgi:hypothetical protein